MKKLLFLTLLFLVFLPNSVKGECSDSDAIRLQKLANNVTVSYVYNENNDRFDVTLSNLNKELEIIEIDTLKKYSVVGDLNIKNLYSGKHGFIIYSSNKECGTSELITKYVMLPYKNPLYNSEICEGIENYSYCNKWSKNSISHEIWYKKINEYKENKESKMKEKKYSQSALSILFGKFKKLYGEYYYIILPIVIVTLLIIIAIKNKKDSLI